MPWESRPVSINKSQEKTLRAIIANASSPLLERTRAEVVLLLAEGIKNKDIAEQVGVHENTVVKWRGRWTGDNQDSTVSTEGDRTGRPRSTLTEAALGKISKIVASKPPKSAPRWTVRSLAHKLKLPVATTQRALVELQINLSDLSNT